MKEILRKENDEKQEIEEKQEHAVTPNDQLSEILDHFKEYIFQGQVTIDQVREKQRLVDSLRTVPEKELVDKVRYAIKLKKQANVNVIEEGYEGDEQASGENENFNNQSLQSTHDPAESDHSNENIIPPSEPDVQSTLLTTKCRERKDFTFEHLKIIRKECSSIIQTNQPLRSNELAAFFENNTNLKEILAIYGHSSLRIKMRTERNLWIRNGKRK